MEWKLCTRVIAMVFVLCFTAPLSRNQEYDRRDGNWWNGLDPVSKPIYVAGLLDGMQLGADFSVWGVGQKSTDCKDAGKLVQSAYADYRAKYLTNVTNIRILDGLDGFYSDAKNRGILVNGATWLVLNQIAGKPPAEMQALVDKWRSGAEGGDVR
jgi:hypothetical protein